METKEYLLEPEPRLVEINNEQDDIFIEVLVGNGQIGGGRVEIDDSLLAKGDLSEPTHIGEISELKGEEIQIITNVLDTNPFTDTCIITTTFYNQDGDILFTKLDKGKAPQNGAAIFRGLYVLRTILLLIFTSLLSISNIQAQDKLEFQNLATPTSPGFILFDQTPSSIERPTTPQGFGLSLLGFQQNGGAIEFAPFWLKDHPNLKPEDLYERKTPIDHHLSFSLASIETDDALNFALGFRTRILQIYKSSTKSDLLSKKQDITNELSAANVDFDEVEKLRKEYVELVEKPIFNIDLATAIGWSSLSKSFESLEFNRWAAWFSLNYRPSANNFYITILNRYIRNEKIQDVNVALDLIDIGTRLNYDLSRFTLSIEYLNRVDTSSDEFDDFKLAFIGSYKLSDNIYLTSTYGKGFSENEDIIALLGVNFGISNSKLSFQ